MITVDKALKEIASRGFDSLNSSMSKRDIKILKNLSVLITKPEYISENQGKLLLKIFDENSNALNFLNFDIKEITTAPVWSRSFRKVIQTRKITISQANSGEKFVDIEFTFSASLKKLLQNLIKKVDGTIQHIEGKLYRAMLTERNVVAIVDTYKNHNFDISTEILNFYSVIKSWNVDTIQKDFEIDSERGQLIKNKIKEKLNLAEDPTALILADRKIRFQYQFSQDFSYDRLAETLANRYSSKVHVNSTAHSMTELLTSLIELHRFPILVVFNGYSESESLKNLEKMSKSLDELGITEKVGIYFRFENTPTGKIFNQTIAEKKYNANLDDTTKIAGILGGKIPKFFLKTNWKPQAVISFTNNLKHNKTSVYCNDCDLIIYYNEKQPLAVPTQWNAN